MPGGLVICADDYALSRDTSAVIRDLLTQGALNATTCLVETADWKTESGPLRRLAEERPCIAVGLHLNLTERFVHCPVPDAVKPVSWWLTAASWSSAEPISARALASWRAQWALFVEAFGRAPDFIDGHQHVHLYAPARRALTQLVREKDFQGWVRQCRTSSKRWNSQRLIYDPLSAALREDVKAAGCTLNPGFGGLRGFRQKENVERLWREDLVALNKGGLLITHPGALGSPAGSDGIDHCRIAEAALFADGGVRDLLASLRMALAENAKTPNW